MWSDWLVFCDCGFQSALWWRKLRGLWKLTDGRDWLRGNLVLIQIGGAMLSKSLIQFSVDGRGCVPSLLFTWSQTMASLVAQMVKRLPAMPETWVQSLGREDPLEKKMATHSSILAWEIPWTEEPGGLQSIGSRRSQTDLATKQQKIVLWIGVQKNSAKY